MTVRITAKQPGFRRCGVAHSVEPTDHPDDRFSASELAILKSEPELTVEVIASGPPPASAPLNVAQTVELVNAATSLEELGKLAEGETRKGVLDAINKRSAALAPPPAQTASPASSDPSQQSDQSAQQSYQSAQQSDQSAQ